METTKKVNLFQQHLRMIQRLIELKKGSLVLLELWRYRSEKVDGKMFWYSSPHEISRVCRSLGISDISFREYMSKIVKSKMIIRVSNGIYEFLPEFISLITLIQKDIQENIK